MSSRIALSALVTLGAVLAAQPASAHDFWISLDSWHVPDEAKVQVDLLVGTGAEPEQWKLRPERVVAFRSIAPDRTLIDHTASLDAATSPKLPDATVRLTGEGSHLLVFESTPALSELAATAFDDYVAHEGLKDVATHRANPKTSGTPGRELYARRAKALVQIGTACSANALQPQGLALEIVPLVNPHCPDGDSLPVEVRFRGQPLAGALVRMENLSSPAGEIEQRTNAEGRVVFAMPKADNWKISLVWSVPIEDSKQAEYDTLFSSLSFGFAGGPR